MLSRVFVIVQVMTLWNVTNVATLRRRWLGCCKNGNYVTQDETWRHIQGNSNKHGRWNPSLATVNTYSTRCTNAVSYWWIQSTKHSKHVARWNNNGMSASEGEVLTYSFANGGWLKLLNGLNRLRLSLCYAGVASLERVDAKANHFLYNVAELILGNVATNSNLKSFASFLSLIKVIYFHYVDLSDFKNFRNVCFMGC